MIDKSELILNSDNSVYHLNLLPHQIAKDIIFVGDQNRVEKVSKYFDKIEHIQKNREFVTHTGVLNNKRISVISTGIGTDNIDIVINELDALVNIDLEKRIVKPIIESLNFYRIGTSGSLQKDIELDSLIVSKYAIGLDSLMSFYSYLYSENELKINQKSINFFKENNIFTVEPYTVKSADILFEKFKEFNSGITVTNTGFYAPQGRFLRAENKLVDYQDTLSKFVFEDLKFTNMEMETAGIYGLSNLLNHNSISLNIIIANRFLKTFSINIDKTVDNYIQKLLEIITK